MNDTEISYALARALGWGTCDVYEHTLPTPGCQVWQRNGEWRQFDYRDPTVWAGLVDRYGLSVVKCRWIAGWEAILYAKDSMLDVFVNADTPAKAVALLVLELAEHGKLPERKA